MIIVLPANTLSPILNKSMLKPDFKKIPKTPGVYLFLGSNQKVLYVGKATSLKQRLNQYFQSNVARRIGEMVSQAKKIKFYTLDSILEATILESNLIKKYWPKYNIKDKDDRSFVYIVFPKTKYPAPLIVRGRELKKFPAKEFKVFGPYQSFYIAKNILNLLRKIFPYSTCRPFSGKPCFESQIGLCPGLCTGSISRSDYLKNISKLILVLKGERQKLIKKLIKDNPAQAKSLRYLQDVALIKRDDLEEEKLSRLEAYDISHFSGHEAYGSMVVFSQGEADKKEYRLFKIKASPKNDDLRALTEVLSRRLEHKDWPRPDLILIDGGKPQIDFVANLLAKKNFAFPLVGLSKLAGDKLVFAKDSKKNLKLLAENIKPTLLKARDEAHRFANFARRRANSNRF